ncbi:MAG: hypothetical protein HRU14_08630 [Planctomycetes bacterium]|nr:hypothetical protein [Planctomycetota bacterium]
MRFAIACLLVIGSLVAQPATLPDQAAWFTRPRAEPVPEENDLPARLTETIDAARKSVAASFIRLDLPVVLDALIAAHRRGVAVRVMTDDDMRAYRFAIPLARLEAAGVAVRTDRGSPWAANLHHKFCIVDGTWVWNGDWNATIADAVRARGSAFRVRSPGLAKRFEAYFGRLWEGRPAGIGSPSAPTGPPAKIAGGGTARVSFGFAQDLAVVVSDEILKAKRSVDVAHAVFADHRVLMTLLEVARRGVRVRVVTRATPGPARVEEACARFGIPVVRSTATKTVIVDGVRVITGSWNCTRDVDHENVVVLEGCKTVIDVYRRETDAIIRDGSGGFFLTRDDPGLRGTDRQREELLRRLGDTRASELDGVAGTEGLDRAAPPVLTFVTERPWVEPKRVSWCEADRLDGCRRVAVTFERGAHAPRVPLRFVVSTRALSQSNGHRVSPRIRPIILDAPRVANLDGPLVLPFDLDLPVAGSWRVDLDAFVAAGEAWRWVASWRLPPLVRFLSPHVSLDDAHRRRVTLDLAVAKDGWRARRQARRSGDTFVAEGLGARLQASDLDVQTTRMSMVRVRVTSHGEAAMRISWSQNGKQWLPDDGCDVPLLTDHEPHTYSVDLSAVPAWNQAGTVRALRLDLGIEGRDAVFHGLWFVRDASLGPAAAGTFKAADGTPRSLLEVAGAGDPVSGRIWIDQQATLRIKVRSPDPAGGTVPFLLLVRRGVPSPDESFALDGFQIAGRLCFRPHLVDPPGAGVSGVADSTGLDPKPFKKPGPAPVVFEVPLPRSRTGDALVLQAVFTGEHRGVSNAITIRVR